MSMTGNISMLSAAMRAFQDGQNVVSQNVINAAVPGYSRQRLTLESLPPLTDGGMQFGTGIVSTGIERIRDIYLDNQIKFQLSSLGKAEARNAALNDLAAIFPEIASSSSTAGIRSALTAVTTAWSTLATDAAASAPAATIIADQTVVRNALDHLANLLNIDSRLAYDAQENLDLEVGKTITQINTLLDRISALNVQIASATSLGRGNAPGTLLDARERAAEDLAKLIGANFRVLQDGSMSVTFSGGPLVDHGDNFKLQAIPSATDPGRTGVGYHQNNSNVFVDVTNKITDGKLGGFIQTRDVDAEEIRLALDKIAYGMIQRSNEINKTAIAADTTTSHGIFLGTKASDITLDPLLRTNVSYIGVTRNSSTPAAQGALPGDVARVQAALGSMYMYSDLQSSPIQNLAAAGNPFIDPTAAISTQYANFKDAPGTAANPTAGTPGQFVIASASNAAGPVISWLPTDSINDIINKINIAGGGSIFATFDQTAKKMFIYGQVPLQAYDINGSFIRGMHISAVVTSSAPINNSPTSALNQVTGGVPMNQNPDLLNLFTAPYPPLQGGGNYNIKVDAATIPWQPGQDIPTVLTNISNANTIASGNKIYFNVNLPTQIVSLVHEGTPGFNAGVSTAAKPMKSISVSDVTGNLTRVFNFDTDGNATTIFTQFKTALGSRITTEDVNLQQAKDLVKSTQKLQDQVTAVDFNEEMAQANLYRRAYEASVRLQSIMDEMMNVLINHMGSSSMGNSSAI